MRLLSRRFIAAVATVLTISAASATCDAATPPTAPPPGSVAECDAVYKRTQFVWKMFELATQKETLSAYRFVDSQLWHVAPFLAMPLCMETDKTHSRAMMDAKRYLIGLTFDIAGAFAEANLKKYSNARSFTNSFDAGVAASTTPTQQSRAALEATRKLWPGFDQFLAHWKSEMKKLEKILDTLKVPKDTQLDPAERPGS